MEAVANYSDTDVMDLPPLFYSIDPDALDALIRSMSDGSVSFTYAGQRITVTSRGAIRVGDNSTSCECEE